MDIRSTFSCIINVQNIINILFQDLKDIIPKPDLRPLEVHLMYLKRNISKAIPINRLCSKTDAIAYHRAAAHLVNFKVRYLCKKNDY